MRFVLIKKSAFSQMMLFSIASEGGTSLEHELKRSMCLREILVNLWAMKS